jgi:hypothetical protein
MGLYHSPRIVTDGLVMCLDAANTKSYPGSGTSWRNLSSGDNNGTLENAPTFNAANLGSISLDGIDDRVLITCAASAIRCYDSTTQFIVKLPLYSGGQRCIMSYRGNGGSLYIGKGSGGIFCYYNTLNSPGYTIGTIPDNSIAIVHVTCDATNNLLTTYINGVSQGGVSRTGWSTSYNTSFYLGYDNGGTNEYMLGNFYHFAHYNRVLSAAQISQNFNALRGRYGL